MPHVKYLLQYPGKSMGAAAVREMTIRKDGIDGDRVLMVVDRETGKVITSRTTRGSQLLQVGTRYSPGIVHLSCKGIEPIDIVLRPQQLNPKSSMQEYAIFKRDVRGVVDPQGSAWFSTVLAHPVHAVYNPPPQFSFVGGSEPSMQVLNPGTAFTDGAQVTGVSLQSIVEVGMALPHTASPFTHLNARMNLLFAANAGEGLPAFVEDTPSWSRLQIGNVSLEVTHQCVRCAMPTRNPKTGEIVHRTLLKTLRTLRDTKKPLLGVNYRVITGGVIRQGDDVILLP